MVAAVTIRDRLYFRFGLFHSRYGRMWCAFLEGLIIGTVLLALVATLIGAGRFLWWMAESYTTAEARVVQAQKVAMKYEQVLLACLNGGLVAVTEHELIGCEGAREIRK